MAETENNEMTDDVFIPDDLEPAPDLDPDGTVYNEPPIKYYWKNGFYISSINKTIPEDAVEISEELYKTLLSGQGGSNKISTGDDGYPVLVQRQPPSLVELKDNAYHQLWKNYKDFQRTYVDPEDLTLANTCALGGSEKGAAVRQWVLDLWAHYYEIKDQIDAAETEDALTVINISTNGFSAPPYTIRELNEEALIALKTLPDSSVSSEESEVSSAAPGTQE